MGMETIQLDDKGLKRITELRDDELFRLVIARGGEYGAIYRRDGISKKIFVQGVELVSGVCRVDRPWHGVFSTTWEGLAYAWAREMRHVDGKFVIAYKSTGTEDHIQV
jgi:hypothetical protein